MKMRSLERIFHLDDDNRYAPQKIGLSRAPFMQQFMPSII